MKDKTINFGTLCLQPYKDTKTTKPHQLPIYASSSFKFNSIDEGIRIFEGQEEGHVYTRYGNPTIDALASRISELEAFGHDLELETILCNSGMSAIHTLLHALQMRGRQILAPANLYGGTTELFNKILSNQGIEWLVADLKNPVELESILKKSNVGAIFLETPSNPCLDITDIGLVSDIAHQNDALVIVDNTVCTPYIQQPIAQGADFSLHSTTKYLNGHGQATGGAIVGKKEHFIQYPIWETMKLAGSSYNPFEAWLVYNGIKTLELRMQRHCANASALAIFLNDHKEVKKVNYCGLESHDNYQIGLEQMRLPGALLSFELKGGIDSALSFMNRLQLCALVPSLGELETMVLHPVTMSHRQVPITLREKYGITDGLIRISVGIESAEDIITDLGRALEQTSG